MENDLLDEELSMMYEESARVKVLDSNTFLRPIKHLRARKPCTLRYGQTVNDAIALMQKKHVSCILVTEKEALVGILTERDIITKMLSLGKDPGTIDIREIATRNPESFQPEDSIAFVVNAMHVGGYRHVPIVDERNVPVAMVSAKDIISFIADNFPDEVLNLPPRPIRKTKEREGA